MKPISTVYMEILQDIAVMIQKQGKMFPSLQDKQMDFDITAAVRLLEQGYSSQEIRKMMYKNSPYLLTLKGGKDEIEKYLSNVFQRVNQEWQARSSHCAAAAVECYKNRADGLLGKYSEYQPENFGLYQDGQIAITMVEKDGFPKEIVKETLHHHSRHLHANQEYFEVLDASIDSIHDRYTAISSFDLSKPIMNEREMYLKFAKKRMLKNGGMLLSGSDDQKIFRSIYAQLLRGMRKQEKDLSLLPDFLERILKPALIKAVRENSPVYAEAGRNQDVYLTGLLTELRTHIQEQEKRYSNNAYVEVSDLFEKFAQDYEKKEIHKLSFSDYQFRDSVITKKLLEARQAPEFIMRAICEHTYYHNKDKKIASMGDYAKFILQQAEESLHAEKLIQNFELQPIPEGATLADTGLSVKDLYRQVLKERIETYPSFGLELSESFADRDAVEKIFHRFPSCDRLAVKEAILECSPRAQLPGIPESYADSILQSALKRLERADNRKKEQMEFEKNYNKLRGLSTEGVQGESPMNRIKDGKIALKMLRQHVSKDDIVSFLVKFSQETAEKAERIPAKKILLYATAVVVAAELVLHREQILAAFDPLMHPVENCQTDLLGKMHTQYSQDPSIRTDMDVNAMRQMILENKYPRKEIKEAILSVSPSAAEPGRDRGYADYVERMADESIRRDKEKLQNYVLIPPEKNFANVKEAYAYQKEQLQNAVLLPYSVEMDARVARELLDEGYSEEEVASALNEDSPFALDETAAKQYGFDNPDYQQSFVNNYAHDVDYGFAILRVIREITETVLKAVTQTNEKVLSRAVTENISATVEDAS